MNSVPWKVVVPQIIHKYTTVFWVSGPRYLIRSPRKDKDTPVMYASRFEYSILGT